MNLIWDGSHLGDISEYFVSIEEPEKGKIGSILTLKDKNKLIVCYAWLYSDKIPLLIDELKPIFGLPKIGRHSCIIQDTKILIAKREHIRENLFDPKFNPHSMSELQELIILRYILGIVTINDNFWYRPKVGLILYRDITIDFDKKSTKISDKKIEKYFDNERSNMALTMERILKKSCVALEANPKSPTHLTRIQQLIRIKIEETVRRIDPDMIHIVVNILNRIQNLLAEL